MEVFKHILKDSPDFSTLSEIMLRFRTVPYEQFKKELDEWFLTGLNNKDIDNGEPLLSDLIVFVSMINEREGLDDLG